MNLPAPFTTCSRCNGAGEYRQTYTIGCGGGYFSMNGRCDSCEGVGVVCFYERTFPGAPEGTFPLTKTERQKLASLREGEKS